MTADRSERERAAVSAAGLAPVPFSRTTSADVAGCEGFTMLNGRVPGLCHRCERYGHNSRSYVTPALLLNNGTASCDNWRPLLSADQIAAVDETMGHVGTVRAIQPAQVSQEVGGCDSVHAISGGVSSRAGEGA